MARGFLRIIRLYSLASAELGWSKNVRFVQVDIDSGLVMDLLTKPQCKNKTEMVLVGSMQQLLTQNWVVQFRFTYREADQVAD